MKKLLNLYDKYALKFGIAFLIIFTALYPKLPSIHIIRTWVYIRLEDFVILAVTILWFIQLLRKKIKISIPVSIPIFIYWLVGLASLIFSLLYIAPGLTNFFPHIAALNYLRRIEYMILFLIALSTIRNKNDIRDYFVILAMTAFGVAVYGFGQKYYINLWAAFPDFFQKYSFCFPSFQTGNEEFAKGLPLCLQEGARITSTFGGHYDLAAYLVLVIPILLTVGLTIKKLSIRVLILLLFLGNIIILILTSSRISFISYLIAVILALIFHRKKLFIIPVLIISILFLVIFSESTAKRLLSTARLSTVVTNSQGQLIGQTTSELPEQLKEKISKEEVIVQEEPPVQNLPKGSSFIGLPLQGKPLTTNVAVIEKTLSQEEIRKQKLESGSIQISTVSGNFQIRKALVYDISFTTRFQSEWPNALKAFTRNPPLGSGYSTITLASDNSFLRSLGETGYLGLASFIFIFIILGITLKEIIPTINHPVIKGFIYGLTGGTIGLMINGMLIDVFEASKVAENMWILLGIGTGSLLLLKKKPVPYLFDLKKIFTSKIFIFIYLFIFVLAIYIGSINYYFTADDFTQLHATALTTLENVSKYFIGDFHNIIYEPLSQISVFFLYTLFLLQPQGYHIFILLLHLLVGFGVYLITQILFKNKLKSFFAALLFILNPMNDQNIFWFSTLPATMVTTFGIYSIFSYLKYRYSHKLIWIIFTIFFFILAFLTNETSMILLLFFIITDMLLNKSLTKNLKKYTALFLILLLYILFRIKIIETVNFTHLNIIYPLSVAVSIFIIYLLGIISVLLSKNKIKYTYLLLIILSIIALMLSYWTTQKHSTDWQNAGNFTKNTLSALRLDYGEIPLDSTFYFIKPSSFNKHARIFISGLKDSLWFVYQDKTPEVYEAKSIQAAKDIIKKNKKIKNYIFQFQKNGDLKAVN